MGKYLKTFFAGDRNPEGFTGKTLVWTPFGHKPIRALQPNDIVWTVDKKGVLHKRNIIATYAKPCNNFCCFIIRPVEKHLQNIIFTAPSQKFFCPGGGCPCAGGRWLEAKDISNEIVCSTDGELFLLMADTDTPTAETMAYSISVADNHRFFVTDANILVHNNTSFSSTLSNKLRLQPNLKTKSPTNRKAISHEVAVDITQPESSLLCKKDSSQDYYNIP